ncbi:hypothetical protein LI177_02550 [bacterium 210820-DFI.6.37]|nr:hypothetical protein [bacterium 210820-DFI.6.37]
MKTPKNGEKYNILLLTNRDSDNVGDQVIEACDIGLIETVMKNLDIGSIRAAVASKKYLATKDKSLLKVTNKVIIRMIGE